MFVVIDLVRRAACRLRTGHRWTLGGSARQFLRCSRCPAWRHRTPVPP